MNCPNCRAGEISPETNRCDLCGLAPEGLVAEATQAGVLDDFARQELAERFRVDAFLGRGEKSAILLAREHGSSRQIVVKVLPRPAGGREGTDGRFRTAVQAIVGIEHPHIVPVFDFGWTEHLYWYSMQHVQGRSLRTSLLSRGPLDLKACLRLVAQVASALDYVHRRGLVHGGLKPENVLIDAEGWAHVCDLLVPRALDPPPLTRLAPRPRAAGAGAASVSREGRSSGPEPAAEQAGGDAEAPAPEPPPYQAPEDLRTPLSDQYALAVLVYECLAGSPPPRPGSGIAPASLLAGTRPDVPPHVTHSVRRALSPRPIDRFPGVLDFVAALETASPPVPEVLPSATPTATILRVTDWEPPGSPLRQRVILAGLVVVLVVAGVLLRPVIARLLEPSYTPPGFVPVAQPPSDTTLAARPADTTPLPAPPAAREARRRPAPPPTGREAAPRTRTADTRRQRRDSATAANARQTPARPAAAAPQRAAAPAPEIAVTPSAAPPSGAAPGADSGRLFVSATPWGQLYVDGRLVGNTPRANLPLAPGAHTIRVVREGFESYERSVTLAPGQVLRLTDIVLAARQP